MTQQSYVLAGTGLVPVPIEDKDPPWGVIFLNDRTAILGIDTKKPLQLSSNVVQRIRQLSVEYGAWSQEDIDCVESTQGIINQFQGHWNDMIIENLNNNDPIWLYTLFTDVDKRNTINKINVDPKVHVIFKLIEKNIELSYKNIGFDISVLTKFLEICSLPTANLIYLASLPATKFNITNFFRTGESVMWPPDWKTYRYPATRLAKQAIFDKQNIFLATRQFGVYVVDGNKLFTLRENADKNIER